MVDLDDYQKFEQIDKDSMLQNIREFPDQIETCVNLMRKFALPSHYIQINKILFCAMGGSAQGAAIASELAQTYSKYPIAVLRDYQLPGWVDAKTLVVAISYSGNTEETLSAFADAYKKQAKLIAVSTGGQLASLTRKFRVPLFTISYGAQPRAALGYTLTVPLLILKKLDLIELNDKAIQEAIVLTKEQNKLYRTDASIHQNQAKQIARSLSGKIPVIIASAGLSEVARRLKTQFNENAKTASYFEIIPEMNHNALMGTEFPIQLNQMIYLIMLNSQFGFFRNRKRRELTENIFKKQGIDYLRIEQPLATYAYSEAIALIHLGDYITYYLSMINEIDPTPVENTDYLKSSLSQIKE